MSREAEFRMANSTPRLAFCPCWNCENENTVEESSPLPLTAFSTSSAQTTISFCISSRVRPSWSSGSVVIAMDTRKGPMLDSGSSWSLGIEPLMAEERSTDW